MLVLHRQQVMDVVDLVQDYAQVPVQTIVLCLVDQDVIVALEHVLPVVKASVLDVMDAILLVLVVVIAHMVVLQLVNQLVHLVRIVQAVLVVHHALVVEILAEDVVQAVMENAGAVENVEAVQMVATDVQ